MKKVKGKRSTHGMREMEKRFWFIFVGDDGNCMGSLLSVKVKKDVINKTQKVGFFYFKFFFEKKNVGLFGGVRNCASRIGNCRESASLFLSFE